MTFDVLIRQALAARGTGRDDEIVTWTSSFRSPFGRKLANVDCRGFHVCILMSLILTSGCVRYHARPLQPQQTEADYRRRSLSDPGLQPFVESRAPSKLVEWPPQVMDLDTLTSIAIYFSPEIEVGRARVLAAESAILTARGRSNASLASGLGYESSPESPWIFKLEPPSLW